MLNAILILTLALQGHPAHEIDGRVYLDGRPGCTATALYNDPTHPVVTCTRPATIKVYK